MGGRLNDEGEVKRRGADLSGAIFRSGNVSYYGAPADVAMCPDMRSASLIAITVAPEDDSAIAPELGGCNFSGADLTGASLNAGLI